VGRKETLLRQSNIADRVGAAIPTKQTRAPAYLVRAHTKPPQRSPPVWQPVLPSHLDTVPLFCCFVVILLCRKEIGAVLLED